MPQTRRERDEFIAAMARENVSLDVARALLRAGATLRRLSEAQCNGDWPCDNGERKVQPCTRCEGGYVRSVLLKGGLCPDCRTEDRVKAICAPLDLKPSFHGDPRGCVLTLTTATGREICVA